MPRESREYIHSALQVADAAELRARDKGTHEAYATGLLAMLLFYATHGDQDERQYARDFVDAALKPKETPSC